MDEFTQPELYDCFNNDCTEDVSWYIEYCRKHVTILELGVGTGRVAIPLAQNGHEVWGLDNSEDMLRLLKHKMDLLNINNIHIINQNMCNFKIERVFDIALVPFCTFNFLLSKEEQRATLISLKQCLNTNSIVIFELLTLYTFDLQSESTEFLYYRTINTGVQKIDIYLKNLFDGESKILKQNRLFRIYNNGKCIEEKNLVMKNRIIPLEEFEKLLIMCGYDIQNIYGNFSNESLEKDSKSMIVIARKVSE